MRPEGNRFADHAGGVIGASTKIWYCCDFGRALSSSLT
jgi:hypothetical protein